MKIKKLLCIICLIIYCIISNNTSVFAIEQSLTEGEVLKIAFRENVPEILELETIDDPKIVFDSRYGSITDAIFISRAVPLNYDYY